MAPTAFTPPCWNARHEIPAAGAGFAGASGAGARTAGIEVRLETRYGAAHNKILLIDVEGNHPVVITGSYNLTFSALARNAENLLILRDNAALAKAYLANWQRHRDDATPFAEALQP